MTSRVVLDASAALHLVMDGESSEAIAERLDGAHLVTAPDLFASEVANGLWRYVEHGDITAEEATDRLAESLDRSWRKSLPPTGCSAGGTVGAAYLVT